MIAPNLAARPFLNTRPVWAVTGAACVLAVLFTGLSLSSVVRTRRDLAPQLAHRLELEAEHDALIAELRVLVGELERVPWRSLEERVAESNLVLRERRFSWLELLDDIERVMPYEVRVIRVAPNVGPNEVMLNLMVVARTRDAMIEFLDNLIGDADFSEPIPQREGLPEESEAAGYQLTLRVRYHPGEASS